MVSNLHGKVPSLEELKVRGFNERCREWEQQQVRVRHRQQSCSKKEAEKRRNRRDGIVSALLFYAMVGALMALVVSQVPAFVIVPGFDLFPYAPEVFSWAVLTLVSPVPGILAIGLIASLG